MVHRNIHDKTVTEALEHENGLAVLGFLFEIVRESEPASEGMDTLARIAEKFLVDTGSKFSQANMEKEVKIKILDHKETDIICQFNADEDVNVVNFLPVMMDGYYHYKGSLTTGGCEESVNWMVFKSPLAIKEKHLRAFQSLKNKNKVWVGRFFYLCLYILSFKLND